MLVRRTVLATAIVATVIAAPTSATADGGAYLEFDRTYYVPGDRATVTAFVDVPRKQESLFQRGPFYVVAVPRHASLIEGRPIPAGAVRLATLAIEEQEDSYALTASFMVPDLGWGFHEVDVCNDPCTLTGFRQPLTGGISLVDSRREARLLSENGRLSSRVFGLRRQLRRAVREIGDLESQLGFATSDRERLSARIASLQRALDRARAELVHGSDRPAFDPWVVGSVIVLAVAVAVLTLRRRRLMTELSPAAAGEDREPGLSSSLPWPTGPSSHPASTLVRHSDGAPTRRMPGSGM